MATAIQDESALRWYSVAPWARWAMDLGERMRPWRAVTRVLGWVGALGPFLALVWLLWFIARETGVSPIVVLGPAFMLALAWGVVARLIETRGMTAMDYPKVVAIGIGEGEVVFERAGGLRVAVPAKGIRAVRSGRASEFHSRWAGPWDETEVLLWQPTEGAERLWIPGYLRGYVAAVLALKGLAGGRATPTEVVGRRVAFAHYWLARWIVLGLWLPVVGLHSVAWRFSAVGDGSAEMLEWLPWIVLSALVAAVLWVGLPWDLRVEADSLVVRHALWTRRIPWAEVTGVEEKPPAVYRVRSGDWSLSLTANGVSPLAEVVAAVAHFANLPIPDFGGGKEGAGG